MTVEHSIVSDGAEGHEYRLRQDQTAWLTVGVVSLHLNNNEIELYMREHEDEEPLAVIDLKELRRKPRETEETLQINVGWAGPVLGD
jgi:hypothetical protein